MPLFSLKVHFCTYLLGTKVSLPHDVLAAFVQCDRGACWVEKLPVILVVEDDQLIQRVVEESLTDGGFEIVIASSGENAVELLDASAGTYRALVTDINLGRDKIDGWDVARHAREIDPNFPVVYMSGRDAGDWASKGVPHSIMLGKPFAPAQLVTAVSQLLNTGTPPA
jgi:DNA-binding response OmpR family regulator